MINRYMNRYADWFSKNSGRNVLEIIHSHQLSIYSSICTSLHFIYFGCATRHGRSSSLTRDCPLHWKCGVLINGPPRKSLSTFFKVSWARRQPDRKNGRVMMLTFPSLTSKLPLLSAPYYLCLICLMLEVSLSPWFSHQRRAMSSGPDWDKSKKQTFAELGHWDARVVYQYSMPQPILTTDSAYTDAYSIISHFTLYHKQSPMSISIS